METGRNIDEIIRIIDSLQARDDHGEHIVTKAGWKPVSISDSVHKLWIGEK
jgi:alkyl hydroperoxide reductase subunit AhpC